MTAYVPPAPVVARLLPTGDLALAHRIELFLAGVAIVGVACFYKLPGNVAITIKPLHLIKRPLVVIKP